MKVVIALFAVMVLVNLGFVEGQFQYSDEFNTVSLGIDTNLTEMEDRINLYKDSFENATEGLSIEEIVEDFPRIFNITVFGPPGRENTIIPFGMKPIYEGVFRSANGTEIVRQLVQNPPLVLDTFYTLVNNLDFSEIDNLDLSLLNYGISFLVPLLQDPFRDFVADLIVEFIIVVSNQQQTVSQVVEVMQEILDALEQAEDVQGVISGLIDLASSSDVIIAGLTQALSDLDVDVDKDAVVDFVAKFLVEFQNSLDLDDQQWFDLIKKILQDALAAIS